MTILNLGSINIDIVYRVPHLPAPGETLASTARSVGLGGKGANQSIAAAQAGADVVHLGAVGADGGWCVDRLVAAGVNAGHVVTLDMPTGHAVINVDDAGENAIVLFRGANGAIPVHQIGAAVAERAQGDWLLFQNETNNAVKAARLARQAGLQIAYAAAPFDAAAVREVLGLVDLLAVNEIEAKQLALALSCAVDDLPVPRLLVTLGKRGALYRDSEGKSSVAAFATDVVDTTGAGDTFLGYFLAGLDQGLALGGALARASAAAALQVSRPGAAEAIPTQGEVDRFLAAQ